MIDALLAEFSAVDEPFGALAPRSTTSAEDALPMDEPFAGLPEVSPPRELAEPVQTPAALVTMAIEERPVPALAPEQAEVLSAYLFEDELGQEFRIGEVEKAPNPEGELQDLLKSYLDEASS